MRKTCHSELSRIFVKFSASLLKFSMFRQRFFPRWTKMCRVPMFNKKITADLSVFCLIFQKLYKRSTQQRINEYFQSLLSKFSGDIRQGFSTQQCLLVMVKKMREISDNNRAFPAVLITSPKLLTLYLTVYL